MRWQIVNASKRKVADCIDAQAPADEINRLVTAANTAADLATLLERALPLTYAYDWTLDGEIRATILRARAAKIIP